MEWLLAFALGIVCAWLLLRSLKWLPCALFVVGVGNGALGSSCTIVNGGSSTIYVLPGNYSGACANVGQGANVSPGGSLGVASTYGVWACCQSNPGCSCSTANLVAAAGATGTITVAGCNGGSGDTAGVSNVYFGNYCITNDTGHPGTWKFSDNCGYSQSQNLAPGTSWCVSYSNGNLSCFPVGFSWTGWDGSGMGWGPPLEPDGTNSAPTPVGVPSPAPGAGGPNPGGGPSGTNGATGGDLGKLQTNLTTVLNVNLTWLGNVIGGNQALQLAQGSGMSNRLSDLQGNMIVLTNELGPTNLQSPYLSYLTNQSKLSAVTNLLTQMLTNNLNTNLDNYAGSNLFFVGQAYSTNDAATAWGASGMASTGSYWALQFTNAYGSNVYPGLSAISSISNFTVPAHQSSIWQIPSYTNMAAGLSGAPRGNIDIDPTHFGLYTATAGWVRIMAYWGIVTWYLTWAYALFFERASMIPLVPSQNVGGDTLGKFTLPIRLGIWGALVTGFPALAWAVFGSWQSWPGAGGAPVSPFAGTTLAGFGAYGGLFSEALSMVDTFFPLLFAAAVVVSMVVVRVTVDSIAMFLFMKVKWI